MKMLLFLLAIITCSNLHAQKQQAEKEEPRYRMPNWDSLDNARLGTDYMPFSITMLDGGIVDNLSVKGKVTFFTFWNRYCAPCLAEFSVLNELYDNFRNDTNVVFVAITYDKKEDIADVLAKYKVRFPVATVSSVGEATAMNYGRGYPNEILLDKHGKIRRIGYSSFSSSENKTTAAVDSVTRLINRYKRNG